MRLPTTPCMCMVRGVVGAAPIHLPTLADFTAADPALRALYLFKRPFGVQPAADGVAGGGSGAFANASVTIGTFPIAEVYTCIHVYVAYMYM